jgi:thiosulfate/3-mercaptopyruvate sulfurtransferase
LPEWRSTILWKGSANMGTLPGSLVTTEWLAEHLDDPRVRVVDIRGAVTTEDLGGGRQKASYAGAPERYAVGHIPGAVFVDWTKDIIDPDADVKAQIASPERFASTMKRLGVGDDSAVVVVDDTGGHLATRLWWALRYYGHAAVAALDGGFFRWVREGRPVIREVAEIPAATFTPRVRPELRATLDEVRSQLGGVERQLLDARDDGMYSGATQRGSRGGHIPGAVNLPAASLMREDGGWRSPHEIRAAASEAGVALDRPVTAYCNGGVTATQLLFGLHLAGMPLGVLRNYDGSWNEWGERDDVPVEGNRDLFAAGR